MNPALSYAARQLAAGERMSQVRSDYDFSQQVDAYIDGKMDRHDSLYFGQTTDIYQQIGLVNLPWTMNQQHVHDALNKSAGDMEHYMSEYGLKALPELARRPIAVIKSKTHPDTSVVAILDGTVNGKQLIAAIRIGEEKNINGENYSVNIVASAYGKNKAVENMLTDAINQFNQNGEGVYYIDTQKARQLFTRAGVQFPWSSSQNGLIQNITDKASPVNQKLIIQQTNTPQFKRWFGNSKVKNTNGTPRILYHQTNKEFSTFDRMRLEKALETVKHRTACS